jgi:hypothetical protein
VAANIGDAAEKAEIDDADLVALPLGDRREIENPERSDIPAFKTGAKISSDEKDFHVDPS